MCHFEVILVFVEFKGHIFEEKQFIFRFLMIVKQNNYQTYFLGNILETSWKFYHFHTLGFPVVTKTNQFGSAVYIKRVLEVSIVVFLETEKLHIFPLAICKAVL